MAANMDLDKFREAGRIAGTVREFGKGLIQPGVRLAEIVQACDDKIREMGGEPAFPAQISRNHIAAHYCPAPDDPQLVEKGDILKLDLGAHVDGYVADNAVTVDLRDGNDSPLCLASKMALENVIANVGPGVIVSELGRIVYDTITALGFKPVYNLTGHGVARYQVHCKPQIPNYDDKKSIRLKPGQVIAVEPFATDGEGYINEVGKAEVFQLVRPLKKKDKLDSRIEVFLRATNRLPFARRDLHRHFSSTESELVLGTLRKKRLIHEYPPLAEKEGVRISQHEHTIMITESGAEVTTRVAS
ncbi:MAG: type II methionyl aminopeptidase [Planctomycetota bacterium]|nr:MAG: type II methionyl aminopeptidase [Planctomycetota bacterium]